MAIKRPTGDLYAQLEVHPGASDEVINAAWKALAKKHRTDLPGNEAHGRLINEAHQILTDPLKRREYDEARVDRTKQFGSFRVIEKIAEGGFGRTYRGEHVLTGGPVCIKDCLKLSAHDSEILTQEAMALWDLRHHGLPAMKDLIRTDDGSLVLVMSYIQGLTLEKIIEKTGKGLPPEHMTWIVERIFNILSFIHRHGVVHGDIKPQNIIVQPESHTVVLCDFGLSAVKPTQTTVPKGHTLYYAPPEQMDEKPLVPESDFYSLAMTMIYGLSGSHDAVQKLRVPESTPDPICAFMKRMMARSISGRPHWKTEDLCETIQKVRRESFGRTQSGMSKIPGL